MGVCHYILQEGEVCADYDRLKKIMAMIHPDETYINIVSNGWGMTREKIEELRDLQADKITFSLDSGIEAEDAAYIYNLYKNSSIMDNGQTMVKRDLYRGGGIRCAFLRRQSLWQLWWMANLCLAILYRQH